MTLKRYCAKCSKYSISLILEDGRDITLKFEGKNVISKERFADVADPLIQKALEETDSFNNYFYKSNEFDWMKEGDEVDLNMIAIIPAIVVDNLEAKKVGKDSLSETTAKKEFTNASEAKNWLHEEHGIAMAKLGNKTIITEKALELGFEVSFLTDQK